MQALALEGVGVLVVEDDYFIASDIEQMLTREGARVIGPFSRAEQAREMLQQTDLPAAAVLDINVGGAMIYPLAEELRGANVPFVFATGYDANVIPEQFKTVRRVAKPLERHRLVDTLTEILRES
jgi:DNA-binding response OmpR family regulator